MSLYGQTTITVESWVEMTRDAPMRCETDRLNERATLYFGLYDEYVLTFGRRNLEQVISLCTTAISELDAEKEESG